MNYLFNNNHLNEYLGEIEQNYSDCTTEVQPPLYLLHTIPCWNIETKTWDKIIPDYRNMTAYQKTNSLIKQTVLLAGLIDTKLTVIAPPDLLNWYEFNGTEWNLHVNKLTKSNLSLWLYLLKCKIAYTGINIIQDGVTYTFETSLDSITMCNSTAIAIANQEETYKLYWKVYKGNLTTFIYLTKSQFTLIFAFGMTMINQAFGVESDRNIIVNAMSEAQLADEEFIQDFKETSVLKFNLINKTYLLVTLV